MRWIVRGLSLLLMLVILAVGAAFLIPSQKVAQIAAREFGRATGRALTIEGTVKPRIWPVLGVRVGAVSLANADWSDAGPMLRADTLDIGIDLTALIGGVVKITRIEAEHPVIVLERAADGRVNWEFAPLADPTSPGAPDAAPAPFTLDRATISGGSLTYVDHAAGSWVAVTAIKADLTRPFENGPSENGSGENGPVDLALAGDMNGQAINAKLRLGDFGAALAGRLAAISLAANIGGAKIGFDGRAGFTPMVAEGQITADLGDLRTVAALLALPAPALPQGFGAQGVAIAGALTLTEAGSLHLRDATITLDGNRLRGDLDLTPGEARPRLNARITTEALDLTAVGGAGTKGSAASPGWSKAVIDTSALAALDATLALGAQSIDLGSVSLGRTRALITLDRGRAVFDIRELVAYGGTVSGTFVVNGRNGLSVGGDLAVAGLAMQPLLKDMAQYDRLIGTGDLRVKFLSVGNSMDALMHTLSGDGQLSFGKGELRGLDLAGMLRTLDTGYVGEGAKTIFDSITASFAIKDGVLRSDDLKLAAPLITATGKGTVGIGAQMLDFRVLPTALAKADGTGGVKVPLLITGPWAAPKFRLDLESLAQEKLNVEKARLTAEAKARLAKEAGAKLGITAAEGESLQDAAKRRGQEALAKEAAKTLGKLLGGN
ncbi:MAG: AsmA family protein [Paracoccaceae bacterium]|nr:AsmA family protein [Paracoccaceae bacterium]